MRFEGWWKSCEASGARLNRIGGRECQRDRVTRAERVQASFFRHVAANNVSSPPPPFKSLFFLFPSFSFLLLFRFSRKSTFEIRGIGSIIRWLQFLINDEYEWRERKERRRRNAILVNFLVNFQIVLQRGFGKCLENAETVLSRVS